jgi:hypothetical protein
VEQPPLEDIGDGHRVACWHYDEVPELDAALQR